MKNLIFVACFIASVCASHIRPNRGNVVVDEVEVVNHPNQKFDINRQELEAILKRYISPGKEISPRDGTEVTLNDYADKIFANIQQLMLNSGLDPLGLPEVSEGFNYTLIITFHGEFNMTNGWLSDLATIHRDGDVVVSYSTADKYLEITVPVAFNDMKFTYDYAAQIMGLGPKGYIEGIARDLRLEIKIGFSTETLFFSLDEFNIVHAGNIDLTFHGDDLIDWLLDALAFVATDILGGILVMVVQSVIEGGLQSVIQQINDAINGFLNPTTPVPTTTQATLFFN